MVEDVYFGNTFESYLTAFGIFAGLLIAFSVFQKFVIWRLQYLAKKTKTDIDDTLIKIVRSINPPFYFFIALYICIQFLSVSPKIEEYLGYIVIAIVTFQFVRAAGVFVDYLIEKFSNSDGDSHSSALNTLGKVIKGILWTIGLLIILQNIGIEVTSLIAGLGIGGVAVALAAQNILGDLFASFSIIFDKPFRVGDFIQIGDSLGEVKKIGIKTTRLQALQGEELIIGNKEITSNKIQNYGKMSKRRAVFTVGVVYETPKEKLVKAGDLIKKAIKKQKEAELDRVNLKDFADSALVYECVYYVLNQDYNMYMDIQEKINLAIIDFFEKEKISFAYPTRVIYTK